ncbi:hypothetical protein JG688_00002985 [Phytophthora aleatoria]|uniref:D-lactate dehydrogenase (cytochrome) n=1 Tax=Phytophthora aleatoria TaxID=2496075 RepID=A0A8J5M8B8_9STRA|nr:hypothetical protein JG688_00002985 [Phytophthora aleatoria]
MWRHLIPVPRFSLMPPRLRGAVCSRQQSTRRTASPDTISALKDLLGVRLSTSRSVLDQHGTDESYHDVTPPDAVAFVESTEEVAEVIKICAATRTPVIPFGAGTSIEGHISAVAGGVSLNADLRATGLMFPVDPGANATIGGMVATNASGTTTVKYGNMKTNVLSLTAVMADGRIIKTGSKTRKSSAGYDLTRLLIGAEGTLAVVTEVSPYLLALLPFRETNNHQFANISMICSFDKMKDAIDTCTTVMQMGIPVARMEMMDENVVDAVNRYSNLDNPLRPLLIIEHHGSVGELEQQSSVVQEIARDFGAMDIEDLKNSGLFGTIVGHVGDGNFHVLIPFTDDNKEHLGRMKAFSHRLVKRALACGGTCTGEHGIGIGKMDYLPMEHGEAVDFMYTIKKALDPLDIMNPGKIFYANTHSN